MMKIVIHKLIVFSKSNRVINFVLFDFKKQLRLWVFETLSKVMLTFDRIPMNYIVVFLSFVISIIIMVSWRDPKNPDGTSDTNR